MTSEFGWVLIRQDEGGNRYRVGRYATRAEAERVAEALTYPADRVGPPQQYVIEPVVPRAADA
ncbi:MULTISPECIES: SPOR domain-containing protein [Streptomycetaceae]|uniref:SPOR domain-containing protein n=1 Tax=Streptomycetaceae TaxID=2062 RepID=UPI0030098D1E